MAVKERCAIWQIILEELSQNRADRLRVPWMSLQGCSPRSCSTAKGEVQDGGCWIEKKKKGNF